MIINTIGPFWDGNEVWLLTAGGAMFAAFPNWYATLFSGFYLALFLMLLALIVRGVAFEFRSKDEHPRWRAPVGLVLLRRQRRPGAAVGRGDGEHRARACRSTPNMNYVGGFFNLLNPYALLGGLAEPGRLHPARRGLPDAADRRTSCRRGPKRVAKKLWPVVAGASAR